MKYDEATKTFSGTVTQPGRFEIPVVADYPNLNNGNDLETAYAKNKVIINVKPKPITVSGGEYTYTVGDKIEDIVLTSSDGSRVRLGTFEKDSYSPYRIRFNSFYGDLAGLQYDEATKTFSGTLTKTGTFEFPVGADYPDLDNGNDLETAIAKK